jgi:hypothetical protein
MYFPMSESSTTCTLSHFVSFFIYKNLFRLLLKKKMDDKFSQRVLTLLHTQASDGTHEQDLCATHRSHVAAPNLDIRFNVKLPTT